MGDLVYLEGQRMLRAMKNGRDRKRQTAERMHSALMHPSLRWVVEGGHQAHRRDSDGSMTLCGIQGDLSLAGTSVALCTLCYPMVGEPRSGA